MCNLVAHWCVGFHIGVDPQSVHNMSTLARTECPVCTSHPSETIAFRWGPSL